MSSWRAGWFSHLEISHSLRMRRMGLQALPSSADYFGQSDASCHVGVVRCRSKISALMNQRITAIFLDPLSVLAADHVNLASRNELERATRGQVLSQTEMMGKYGR